MNTCNHLHVGNPIGKKKKHLHVLCYSGWNQLSLSFSPPPPILPPIPKDSNISCSHFLSADDHVSVGFSQAIGTSVLTSPLTSLIGTLTCSNKNEVVVCMRVGVLSYAQTTPSGLGVNEFWRVKGQGGDDYNVARVSHASPFQLSKRVVYFDIFDSKCEIAVFQHVSFPRTGSLFLYQTYAYCPLCRVARGLH